MSVVACKVYEDRIEIAADSITTFGWDLQRTDLKHTKLARVRDVVVGSSGAVSESGMMQLFLATHRPKFPDVESVLAFLGEFAEWKNKRTGNAKLENEFIFVFDGRAFVTAGYYVDEIADYHAVGAGCDFATASLYDGAPPDHAVHVAIALSPWCEGPVQGFECPKGVRS